MPARGWGMAGAATPRARPTTRSRFASGPGEESLSPLAIGIRLGVGLGVALGIAFGLAVALSVSSEAQCPGSPTHCSLSPSHAEWFAAET
jgi:hypothetical protein